MGFILVGNPFLREKEFNREQWIAGDSRIRGQMVNDLVEKKLLEGKSREEVTALLGTADVSNDVLIYTVDTGTRFLSDPWLYAFKIYFNSNDTVEYYFIID